MGTLSEDAREALIEHLAQSIETYGWERFVSLPILEPSDRYFPDPYRDDLHGVRAVARRLMHYAGLGDVAVDVFGSADVDDTLPECTVALVEAAPSEVVFEVEQRGSAEDVPLVLAHEVARVFVELRGAKRGEHPYRSVRPDLDEEEASTTHEMRVSTASVLLGFGLLAAKGAHQYRASGDMDGRMARTRWIHSAVGALSPAEATYLLAVQAVVRSVDAATLKRWRRHLSPNQRAALKTFLRELDGDGDTLASRLGLPPRTTWPEPGAPADEPLEDDGWEPEGVDDEEPPAHPVLSVSRHRGTTAVGLAGAGSVVAAFFASLAGSGALLPVLVGIGPTMGIAYLLGRTYWHVPLCTVCEARLIDGAEACPGCGGIVVGEMQRGETIHEAEARLGFSAFGVLAAPQDDADPRYVDLDVKCPTCAWIPDGKAHWECEECPAPRFNTFEHGGRCPSCEHEFQETWCPSCESVAPYEWWWPEDE